MICYICKNTFSIGELNTLLERKNIYGKIVDRICICKKCKEEREVNRKIDQMKQEEIRKKNEEDIDRMEHDEDYESIIGLKIIDVLSNDKEEVDVILENGKKLHHQHSEWGSLDIQDI